MDKFYVYIIYSEKFDKYYRGITSNPLGRLQRHNCGFARYTKKFRPWKLVYIETFDSKHEALLREKKLKKFGKVPLRKLISSPKNELKIYLQQFPSFPDEDCNKL